MVVEDGVSGTGAPLVVVCPVEASVTSGAVTVTVVSEAFSVWDSYMVHRCLGPWTARSGVLTAGSILAGSDCFA